MPSVLFRKADASWLVGSSAVQRGTSEPSRLAREFKRRIGDPVPMIVGDESFSAEELTEVLLAQILQRVSARQGGPPDGLVVTHPASWGQFRIDSLDRLVRGLVSYPIRLLSEPVAAAIHYSSVSSVDIGEVACVYDLGGGTFDAALLSRTSDGFEFIGQPLGMDRFGGVDIDTTLLQMVLTGAGIDTDSLDETDQSVARGLLDLRRNVAEAKIILSADTDTSVDIFLGGVSTTVRVDRAEFERAIRPRIEQSVDVITELLARSGLEPNQINRVLLVGGSSRIPLVTKLLSARLGRPVVIDTDPKGAVSLGAAYSSIDTVSKSTTPESPVSTIPYTPADPEPLVDPDPVAPIDPPSEAPEPVAPAVTIAPPVRAAAPTTNTRSLTPAKPVQALSPLGAARPRKGRGAQLALLSVLAVGVIGAGAYALTRPDTAPETLATATTPTSRDTSDSAVTEPPEPTVLPEPEEGTTTSAGAADNPGFGSAICSSPDASLVFTGAISLGFDIAVCQLPGGELE